MLLIEFVDMDGEIFATMEARDVGIVHFEVGRENSEYILQINVIEQVLKY